jgi:acetyl esterase/lipase
MIRRVLIVSLIVLTAGSAHAQTKLSEVGIWAVDLLQNYRISPNITYSVANNYQCKLDVYARQNTSGPVPTVLHIHGGGWVAGAKETEILEALPYFELGCSFVNVEYRLASVSLAPAAVEDCRLALRWVHQNAKRFNFDTSRIIVTGGSAGGHLALMTGMLDESAGFDAAKDWDPASLSLPVAAIINWYGITDVRGLLSGPNRQGYAVSWLGGQVGREELARRVSPLTYVRKGNPPIFTVHGDNDELVPYSHAVRLHKALDDAGVPNQLLTIPGGKHGGFTREQMLTIVASIRDFLAHHAGIQ